MPLKRLLGGATRLPGAPNVQGVEVTVERWRDSALDLAAAGGRLVSIWVERVPRPAVLAAIWCSETLLVLKLKLAESDLSYPSLTDVFPCALRMQRAAADLCGVRARDADPRPWLRHAAWPVDYFPLAPGAGDYRSAEAPAPDQYPFLRVAGDGVHEIPVGPVHAGIIEPGHFRFSVVGEKVLKLEARLGYAHKGIERRFEELPIREGHRLAARISGDSTVAYSWAYVQALEGIAGAAVPERALWLRALALESERVANHLGDLGALGNDAGFGFGLAQCSRLKERWLRAQQAAFAHRYAFDFVVPGGTAHDPSAASLGQLRGCAHETAREMALIRSIYDEHAGVRDRFVGAGCVSPDLARQLGLAGLAGRASGQDLDLRLDLPCPPYPALQVNKAVRAEGDVGARVAVRFDELSESVRLIDSILEQMPRGEHLSPVPLPPTGAAGIGIIEGWRGPILLALTAGPDGSIRRCHPHDPSWQNWPVLEHAVIGNIVPDFPLINKSFNLSYSGHDL